MRARCTVCPNEPPELLGLKVFRARGCRGGKQQKVRWSKTGLAPEHSEPKFVWVGVLDTRELVCAVSMQEKEDSCLAPE